jgi:phage tail-like protein
MDAAARFAITVDGYEIASFAELQGITTTVTPIDFMRSGDQAVLTKLPGKTPPTVTLKRGTTTSMDMWTWHEAARMGEMVAARKSASLLVYAQGRDPVARYHLEKAWPSKIELGGLKSGASEIMMESVTLAYEHIDRVP